MKPSTILKYFLAFICFGMLGAKMAKAQTYSMCSETYTSNFAFAMDMFSAGNVSAQDTLGSPINANALPGGTAGVASSIGHTFLSRDPNTGAAVSLSSSAGSNGFLEFEIQQTYGWTAGTTFSLDQIQIFATVPVEVVISSVTVPQGTALSGAPYENLTLAVVQLRPYDPTNSGITEWTLNGFEVAGHSTNGETFGGICGVPEPSSALLLGLSSFGLLARRKR